MNVSLATTPVDYTTISAGGSGATGGDNSQIQQLLQEIGQLLQNGNSTSGGSGGNGGSTPNSVTSSYNQLMSDLSANGTSTTTLRNDAANFDAASANTGGGNSNTVNAVNNMVRSLSDGTFSQQGSQGALEGAASRDGLQGVLTPQINGNSGMGSQDGGLYDGGSSVETASGAHGSLGANTHILMDEMKGGAPTSQVLDNATALKNEATNAGDSGLAQTAQNIINSLSDGTYDAQASASALNTALGAAPNAG